MLYFIYIAFESFDVANHQQGLRGYLEAPEWQHSFCCGPPRFARELGLEKCHLGWLDENQMLIAPIPDYCVID